MLTSHAVCWPRSRGWTSSSLDTFCRSGIRPILSRAYKCKESAGAQIEKLPEHAHNGRSVHCKICLQLVLDEVCDLRDLVLLVGQHLIKADHLFVSNGLVKLCLWRGLHERSVKFMLPSQEKLFVFIVKGHILHRRTMVVSLWVCFDLYFKYGLWIKRCAANEGAFIKEWQSSENGKDVGHGDAHLQVCVLAQRQDVLLYHIARWSLLEPHRDVALHLHAYLADVRHRLP